MCEGKVPQTKLTIHRKAALGARGFLFFSLGATELSSEAVKASGEAARKKPLPPTDNNLTSMLTPISFDIHPQSELILETQQTSFTHVE